MTTVTAIEAEANFRELLDRVGRGEEIVVTKDDKPVARIVPETERDLKQVRRAVANLRKLRREMAQRPSFRAPTDAEISNAINEGRR